MTTIPNLNVVVQQGSSALEAQNVRSQIEGAHQMAAVGSRYEDQKQTTVQKTEEPERMIFNREKSGRRIRLRLTKKKKAEARAAKNKKNPNDRGSLLDTVV